MTRQMHILIETAKIVFGSLGVDLSVFRLQITAGNQYALYLKDTLLSSACAFKLVRPIIEKLPANVKYLVAVHKSVKGGYTAIMPVKVIWEIIIQNTPAVTPFINKGRNKPPSSNFVFPSKLLPQSQGINSQGLVFQHYGWSCCCEKNQIMFDNAAFELQTLVWAMYATGCFYMGIKFDSEPAIFKGIEAPSPELIAIYCQKFIQPNQASLRSKSSARPAF